MFSFTGGCGSLPMPNANPSGGGDSSGGDSSGGGGADPREYMQVMDSQLSYTWYDDIAEGHWSESTTNMPAAKMTTVAKTSVVGKQGDSWLIELENESAQQGYIYGLIVDGKGLITKAYAGKAGDEDVKEIKVAHYDMPKTPEGETPPTADVSVKAGKFTCYKTVVGAITYYTIKDGEWAGISAKQDGGGAGDYELVEVKWEDVTVGDKTFKCRYAKHSNRNEMWTSEEKAYFAGQTLKMVTEAMTMEVTGLGSDAKPQLKWPAAE